MYDLVVEDATIISGAGRTVADVAIEGGIIAYVGANPGGPARAKVGAIGKLLVAGMVDTHVHFRDPGHPAKEDWGSGSRAAVSGGVTTVCDMPNTDPPTLRRAELEAKLARAAALSSAHYGAWVGACADNADEAQALCDEGLACGIKLFMGASTGPLLCDDATLVRFFQRTSAILGVHAEDERLLAARRDAMRGEAAPSHHAVRPTEAAVAAVTRLVELTRAHPRPVHVCHVSTGAEFDVLEAVRGQLPITTEVAPHHLFLSTDDEAGNWTKVNPPIRPESDRRALWAAIRRGLVDTVGSDHAPHTKEEKERPYWDAPSGLPGVELTFGLMHGGVKSAKLTIERMVQLCCEAPARIFGFAGKGRIAVGCDADFILFSEAEGEVLAASQLLTRAGWSPFVGRKLVPKPEGVYVAGRLVAQRGTIVDPDARGSRVRASR